MADMLSVGIDVGTTTTQVVFSKLSVENTASYFSVPKVSIVDKRVIYTGEVRFTPYESRLSIDGAAVRRFVEADFIKAGFSPSDTDTGAVIITGEAARKENAAIVADSLSGFAGDFVVSTAGPDLESILAGKGSGAQRYSADHSCTVANLDIGGGTSNIAVFNSGEAIAVSCLDVGGRLIRVNGGEVSYVAPAARLVADSLGLRMTEGEKTAPCVLERVASRMAGLLLEELGFAPASGLLEQIRTAHSSLLPSGLNLDAVCFSGGVAESVYSPPADGAELFPYGDIGVLLGKAISESDLPSHTLVIRGLEAIRATVVGAGSYATTLSGSTISFSHDIFPLKNIPVVWMDCLPGAKPGEVAERLRWFRRQIGRDDVAISFKGENNPSFSRLESLADTLAQACTIALPPELPLIAVVEADIGKALGQSLQRRLGDSRSVISIDGVSVRQGDYIDLGKPLAGGLAIPVVIKTLIFNDK